MGGTGAIGVYLVPELLKLDYEVHITTRKPTRSDKDGQIFIHGNARCPDFIKEVVSTTRYDAVVDLMHYATDEFRSIYKAILARTEHYLFVSSCRVFADSGKIPITEESCRLLDVCNDAEFLATDSYALAKARQEDTLFESERKNWTILRPGITYSSNRFQLATLDTGTVCFRPMQGIPVILAREILGKATTMTWAGDVARIIGRLVMNERSLSNSFNITTREHHTWEEVAVYYNELLALSYVETNLDLYTQVAGEKYAMIYDRMFDRVFDNIKVLNATEMAQYNFISLKEGLRMELENFTQKPQFDNFDLLLNSRMDKATNSRMSLNGQSPRSVFHYFAEQYPILQNIVSARKQALDLIRGSRR
jgi:nucleoside-diphosphate-sugar epimerase